MSDCKYEKRTDYIESSHYVAYCQHCEADFTKFELETLERAQRAEARVKDLEEKLAKSHDDWYAMGWREALEIAQEKIMRIER